MFSFHSKDKLTHLKLTLLGLVAIVFLFSTACNLGKKKSKHADRDRTGLFEQGLFDQDEFTEKLTPRLPAVDSADSLFIKNKVLNVRQGIAYVYHLSDYTPIWVKESGVTSAPDELIKELEGLKQDGMNPEKYQVAQIQKLLKEIKAEKEAPITKIIQFDTLCTRIYLQASHDLLLGSIPPRRADSLWRHANDSVWNAPARLATELGENHNYPTLSDYRSKIPTYEMLCKALQHCNDLATDTAYLKAKANLKGQRNNSLVNYIIKAEVPDLQTNEDDTISVQQQLIQGYQYYNGLRKSGKVDSATLACLTRSPDSIRQRLVINLERLRWLPIKLEDQYIMVNIPMMELFFRKGGEDVMHFRVVVGRPSRQTPVLNARMANIVFNPSWGVPPTILKKDVLPGLTRSGSSYLASKDLHAFDHNGNPVDAGSINESNYKRFIYRQPPGDRNALGVIKFNFPNPFDVYMHDTPHKEDFPNRDRAKSSGCIRLQFPREMAEYILTELEGRKRFDQNEIDTLVSTHKTKYETLKNKIPVHILYLTAMEDSTGNMVRFANDIYMRDNKLSQLLSH